jgi:hypothetical protein
VPKINQNLVSVGQLIESGLMMECVTLKIKMEYFYFLQK